MKKALRIILFAWWFIPMTWLLMWPITWLFFGAEEATECCKERTSILWNGTL